MYSLGLKSEAKIQALLDAAIERLKKALTEAKSPKEAADLVDRAIGVIGRIDEAGRAILELDAKAEQAKAQAAMGAGDGSTAGVQFGDVVVAIRQRLGQAQPSQPPRQVIDAGAGSPES